MSKATLVFPPRSEHYRGVEITFTRQFPQSGLALLACETERRLGGTDLNIEQPGVVTDELVACTAQCDYLGLSLWFHNCQTGIELARAAKSINPRLKVIAGGVHASNLGARLLAHCPSIDLVVAGDGEDSLWRILSGHRAETIPNLWYRDYSGKPSFTFTKQVPLGDIGPWDFRHLVNFDWRDFDSRTSGFIFTLELPPIPISMIRGCTKAAGPEGRCQYCSICQTGLRTTPPDKVWQQVEHLYSLYGSASYFETGDDFTRLEEYIEGLIETKPVDIPFRLRVYAGARNMTSATVGQFAKLGVYEVFLGAETASDDISQRVGHQSSRKEVEEAIAQLGQAGISVCLPFMFGLPGETETSAQATHAWAEELVGRFDNIRMVLVSLAMPLVGSPWFSALANDSDSYLRYYYNTTGGQLESEVEIDYAVLWWIANPQFAGVLQAYDSLHDHLAASGRVQVGDFGGLRDQIRRRFGC